MLQFFLNFTLSDCNDAIELSEHLEIVNRDLLTTKVRSFVHELFVEHRDYSFVEFFEVLFNLFICWCWFELQFLGEHHSPKTLGHRPNLRVKGCIESIDIMLVIIHEKLVRGHFISSTDVGHLYLGGPIDYIVSLHKHRDCATRKTGEKFVLLMFLS